MIITIIASVFIIGLLMAGRLIKPLFIVGIVGAAALLAYWF